MVHTLICHTHISHLSDFPQRAASSSLGEIQVSEKTGFWFCARSYQFLIITWSPTATQFIGEWFSTQSPGQALRHKSDHSFHHLCPPMASSCFLLKVQIWLLSSFLFCKLNLHKWPYFLHTKEAASDGELLLLPTLFLPGKAPLLSVWLLGGHCWRVRVPSPGRGAGLESELDSGQASLRSTCTGTVNRRTESRAWA